MELLFLTYMFLQHGQAVEQDVLYGIGIKLCNLKCIQKGSCISFAYNIERLECRLSYKDDTKPAKEGYAIYPKIGKEVSAGACSLVNCGPDTRCVKRHRGDTVCVNDVVPEDTGRNIALGQPTIQSSTYNRLASARGAVDGNPTPFFNRGSCSHTVFYPPQWWIVDLKHVYTINTIVIYNRANFQERLDNTTVEGFLHYPATCDNTDASSSVFHEGPSGNVVNVSFNQCTRAQFIRISRQGPLTLCEVEVYGTATSDQGRIDSTIEVKTGKKLRAKATALGLWESHETCLSACKQLPNCYFINHNTKTGECQTSAGLVKKKDFKPSSDRNLYSLC